MSGAAVKHVIEAALTGGTWFAVTMFWFERKTPVLKWALAALGNAFALANDILLIPWAAPLNAAALLFALWMLWRQMRDKRKRALAWLGEKSRALRDRLVRNMPAPKLAPSPI